MLKDLISNSNDFTFHKKKINTDKDPFEIFKSIYLNNEKFQIYRNEKIIYEKNAKDPLLELRRILPTIEEKKLRYIGGAVGYVSYEAIGFWETIPSKRAHNMFALMEFGIYTDGVIHDKKENAIHYFHIGKKSRFNELVEIINSKKRILGKGISFSKPTSETTKSKFISNVKRAKEYVHDGEVFQVVISRKFNFQIFGDPIYLY